MSVGNSSQINWKDYFKTKTFSGLQSPRMASSFNKKQQNYLERHAAEHVAFDALASSTKPDRITPIFDREFKNPFSDPYQSQTPQNKLAISPLIPISPPPERKHQNLTITTTNKNTDKN